MAQKIYASFCLDCVQRLFPKMIYETWRGAAKIYMHAVRTTLTNELMKNSVVDYLSKQLDLTHGMMMYCRCHLSKNQILNIMVFPDQETKEAFSKTAAGNLSSQIKAMGAKVEFLHGLLLHFGIAGDVTLDQLRSD